MVSGQVASGEMPCWPLATCDDEEVNMPDHSGEFVQGSFRVEQEVIVNAPRERVFAALTREIGKWWCHRCGDAGSVHSLEAAAGGRFVESWGKGSVLWGVVTRLEAPTVLRLSGPLGMHTPVSSVYQYTLEEIDSGRSTLLKLSHRVNGEIDTYWKDAHERGWKALWVTLKAWVEEGRAVDPEAGR